MKKEEEGISLKYLLIGGLVILATIVGGGFLLMSTSNADSGANGDDLGTFDGEITVYKSEYCGCCEGWIGELKRAGFSVKTASVDDVASIKNEHGVPNKIRSCHTAIVGNYFIEGHVPMEAVKRLLSEKPDIDGIGLAGMPAGSPGMPGTKTSAFVVYAVSDGVVSEFMTI